MLNNALFNAKLYTYLAAGKAQETAVNVKDAAVENKREIARTTAVATGVYLVARVNGFKAGYEYASKAQHAIA